MSGVAFDAALPLGSGFRVGDRYVALVEEPAGTVNLGIPPPPVEIARAGDFAAYEAGVLASNVARVTLTWGEAWPGERGWCVASTPRQVTLAGVVVDPDGQPQAGVRVTTDCGAPGLRTDAEGRFAWTVWAGPPCDIELEGARLRADRTTDATDLRLMYAPTPIDPEDWERRRIARWEQELAELEAQREMADPFALALASDALSPAAREMLERWGDEIRAGHERRLESLASLIERLRER